MDFFEIEQCQAKGEWDKSAALLGDAAVKLEGAGADFIVICTNTMHKIAPYIQSRLSISVIHIAEATAQKLGERGATKVARLGTKDTMTQDFYKDRLAQAGIGVLISEGRELEAGNSII